MTLPSTALPITTSAGQQQIPDPTFHFDTDPGLTFHFDAEIRIQLSILMPIQIRIRTLPQVKLIPYWRYLFVSIIGFIILIILDSIGIV